MGEVIPLFPHQEGEIKVAADLAANLPKMLEQEEARAREALRIQESAGLLGRLLFKYRLKSDPLLRDSVEYIKIKKQNEAARRSAYQNEGRNIVL